MPVNTALATQVWNRYTYLRDNGHLDYVKKAAKCEDFFAGLQWDQNDLALLKAQRRPALTINKIISTISNVMGEQIFNRTDMAFKPRNEGATSEVADALTKVFMQIADNNQLGWARSDVFTDGIVTSRGFFDVRLDFTDSLRGEVRIEQLNPKNVLIDADADEYDPDKWNDVLITKWMSPDQIELLYGKADADLLRSRTDSYYPYGYDSIDINRDRFGSARAVGWPLNTVTQQEYNNVRNIRVIERQWKKLDKVLHFVDLETGDTRVVPTDWDDDRIAQHLQANPQLATTKKLIQRIRWTVIADNVVLHDDWSPYKHFTVVPYFPYFRRGRTVGLVENLLGPQELLNKVSSQELHVVNTSANSGWKVKRNALTNMSTAELEQRGATSGLVLELDEIANAEKIQPNQTPTWLDRVSYKAEEHIKSISGVSDYMQGFAREDVAAKSVQTNKQSGQANLAKVMDNMNRSDFILARTVLDLVQEYYTEQRLLYITTDRLMNTTEQMTVNQPTPEGRIVRMADQIAYVNHDIEDAVRAGVLDPATLPKDCTAVLGQTKSARITTMINSILAHSDGDVGVGAEENEAFLALRDFMYATVYVDKTAKAEEQKVDKVIGELYEYYLAHVDQMSNFYVQLAYQDDPERAVTDYISGMSDEFAIRTFEDVFVPRKWHVL
jgi:hypothetical protein